MARIYLRRYKGREKSRLAKSIVPEDLLVFPDRTEEVTGIEEIKDEANQGNYDISTVRHTAAENGARRIEWTEYLVYKAVQRLTPNSRGVIWKRVMETNYLGV